MAALIDVVFILLLFFMLTSSFTRERVANINPVAAQAGQQASDNTQTVWINLLADDTAVINGLSVRTDSPAFGDMLTKWARTHQPVVVSAHPETNVQQVIAFLDRFATAKVQKLQLAPSSVQ